MGGNVLDRFRLDGKVALVTGGSRGSGGRSPMRLRRPGPTSRSTARQAESALRAAEVIATTSVGRPWGSPPT